MQSTSHSPSAVRRRHWTEDIAQAGSGPNSQVVSQSVGLVWIRGRGPTQACGFSGDDRGQPRPRTGAATPLRIFWKRLDDPNFISDEEIWALRYKLRRFPNT